MPSPPFEVRVHSRLDEFGNCQQRLAVVFGVMCSVSKLGCVGVMAGGSTEEPFGRRARLRCSVPRGQLALS
jgi:hypothetical protein